MSLDFKQVFCEDGYRNPRGIAFEQGVCMIKPIKNEESTSAILNWQRFNSSLIIEITRGESSYTSSAVVVGRNMLLTAAHSVDCFTEGRVLLSDDYDLKAESIKIKKCIVHPSYNPSKSFFENDLAIVVLEHNLPSHILIEDLRVNEQINLSAGDELQRIGFGGRDDRNPKTWTTPEFKSATFNKTNFVLKDLTSVIGDSGGPVYKDVNGQLKLVGIHSTLEGSDTTYIVNVGKYVDWINANRALRVVE